MSPWVSKILELEEEKKDRKKNNYLSNLLSLSTDSVKKNEEFSFRLSRTCKKILAEFNLKASIIVKTTDIFEDGTIVFDLYMNGIDEEGLVLLRLALE